jgi:hypothetical protein
MSLNSHFSQNANSNFFPCSSHSSFLEITHWNRNFALRCIVTTLQMPLRCLGGIDVDDQALIGDDTREGWISCFSNVKTHSKEWNGYPFLKVNITNEMSPYQPRSMQSQLLDDWICFLFPTHSIRKISGLWYVSRDRVRAGREASYGAIQQSWTNSEDTLHYASQKPVLSIALFRVAYRRGAPIRDSLVLTSTRALFLRIRLDPRKVNPPGKR